MATALQDPAATSASARHHALHGRSLAHGCLFYDQTIHAEVGVVLCVCDRALQRFGDEAGRLFRAERDEIERCRNRQALNCACDFAYLEGRNLRIPICRANLHLFSYFKLTFLRASAWRRSPTLIFPEPIS